MKRCLGLIRLFFPLVEGLQRGIARMRHRPCHHFVGDMLQIYEKKADKSHDKPPIFYLYLANRGHLCLSGYFLLGKVTLNSGTLGAVCSL